MWSAESNQINTKHWKRGIYQCERPTGTVWAINLLFQVGPQVDKGAAGYSLHQLQGDKHHGVTRTGHLLKKSEGKMRRVWQKRKCRVQAEGYLDICHADESKPPTRVNLLTCQIKLVPEDKRSFDLISCKYQIRKTVCTGWTNKLIVRVYLRNSSLYKFWRKTSLIKMANRKRWE